MKRLRPFLALLLALLWLPAMLHCALEEADLSPAGDSCCEEQPSAPVPHGCADDACAVVEDGLFKETSQVIRVSAPDNCACFSCTALAAASPAAGLPRLSPELPDPPRELAAAWQFAVRAAPPAQAP